MLGPPRGAPAACRAGSPRRETGVGVEAYLVVHGTLLWIAQDVIGFLNVLEAVFGGLVAWIEIRVIFAGEFPVCFADILFFRAPFDAECLVVVVFWLFAIYKRSGRL